MTGLAVVPRGSAIRVFPDALAAARAGAASFAEQAERAVRERGRFGVALSGGSTPRAMYSLLAEEPLRSRIPWHATHLFWGDERCVGPLHPRSNFRMAADAFVSRVPIPPSNVHRMRGELPPEMGAREYEAQLAEFFGPGVPRFDLVHLGLGGDGHTASLFPFDLPVLTEREHNVAVARFRELVEFRLTLAVPVLNAATRVEFLVVGAAKASVVRAVLAGPRDPFRLPAQLVRPAQQDPVWMLDSPAATGLAALP